MRQTLINQVIEAQTRYPNLELLENASNELVVRGNIKFVAEHSSHQIEGSYNLKFVIPEDYPASPPFVYETEGKIAKELFPHFMDAGNLCLGAPVEVCRKFLRHGNLLRFIEDQVIPYLFAYGYKEETGKLPFGELLHGPNGLLQYYAEFFEIDPISALKLLKLLADDFAPPLMACPCNLGRKRLRDCHGPRLGELRLFMTPKSFKLELEYLVQFLYKSGVRFPKSSILPRCTLKKQRRSRKRHRK